MAVIEIMSVRRTVLPASPRTSRTKKTAMTMQAEAGGTVLSIPYAPQNVSHTDMVVDYVTVPRPGLIENVVFSNVQRPKMSMDLKVYDKKVVATTNGSETLLRALSVIQAIQSMARKGTRVRIAYGALESGLWYITNLQVRTTKRDPLTDEIIGADVTLDCLRGDSAISGTGTGPVSGGVKSPSKPPPAAATPSNPTKSPAKPSARYHRVKSGDTLYAISIKFYGAGSKWTRIADANRIKDPRKLKIGLNLRIP